MENNKQYDNFYKVKNQIKLLNRKMTKYENYKFVLGYDDAALENLKKDMVLTSDVLADLLPLLGEA